MSRARAPLGVLARTALALVAALWLGGLVALFVSVQALFSHDRELAKAAAPVLFDVFDLYQRGLAVAGVVVALVLLATRPTRSAVVAAVLLAACAVPAAVVAFSVMPKMNALLAGGAGTSPAFMRLHGLSMVLYLAETVVLLAVVLLLPWATRSKN